MDRGKGRQRVEAERLEGRLAFNKQSCSLTGDLSTPNNGHCLSKRKINNIRKSFRPRKGSNTEANQHFASAKLTNQHLASVKLANQNSTSTYSRLDHHIVGINTIVDSHDDSKNRVTIKATVTVERQSRVETF